jgi:hypothetical protein
VFYLSEWLPLHSVLDVAQANRGFYKVGNNTNTDLVWNLFASTHYFGITGTSTPVALQCLY